MPSTNSFLTDRGIATLVDGELMFEESWTGYVRALYDRYWRDGRGTQKAMIIGYALASLSALVFLASVVLRQEVFLIATVVGAVALTWSLDRLRGFRSVDLIPCPLSVTYRLPLESRVSQGGDSLSGIQTKVTVGNAGLPCRRNTLPTVTQRTHEPGRCLTNAGLSCRDHPLKFRSL